MSNDFEAFSEQLLRSHDPNQTADEALVLADFFEEHGDLKLAASAMDRAFGLAPDDAGIQERRQNLLDQFEVIEHGVRFRYVPAGTFLMGSEFGDHDEKPVHPVRLGEYWVAETPVTWAFYCDVNGVDPESPNRDDYHGYSLRWEKSNAWSLYEEQTEDAQQNPNWFETTYMPMSPFRCSTNAAFEKKRPLRMDLLPAVAFSLAQIKSFFKKLKTKGVEYGLPCEAEWEKAARGGLIQSKYSWGDEYPNRELCDFDGFGENELKVIKTLPKNGYGIYSMCGGVYEPTLDTYDSRHYVSQNETTPKRLEHPAYEDSRNVVARKKAKEAKKRNAELIFRGGSWTDCAEAVTVSFRSSFVSEGRNSMLSTPNHGLRIFRFA